MARSAEAQQLVQDDRGAPSEHLDLPDLYSVRLTLTVELGRTKILVRDVLALEEGSVVRLDKMAGEMADIRVNGLPLGRGEIVVVGDELQLRISEISGMGDLLDDAGGGQ